MAVKSPTVRRRRLGIELRKLREAKGLTVEHVAKELDWSPSKVSRIETTPIKVGLVDLRALLDVYGVTEEERREGMLELGKESREPAWWIRNDPRTPVRNYSDFVGFEAEARRIRTYEPSLIPGLLQTEKYTAAILRAFFTEDADVDELIKGRVRRQELLTRTDDPVEYTAIVDEAALRRPAGGATRAEVMHEQIDKILTLMARPNVSVRVLPFDSGLHPGMNGGFTLLKLPHPSDPDMVYVEAVSEAVIINETERIRYYDRVFDGVQQEALGREGSEKLLRTIRDSY